MSENFTDGRIYVSYAHVDNAVDDMRLQTTEIQKIISSLNDELQALKNSWEGEDREVYDEKQAAWNNAVAKMASWLQANAATLDQVRALYTSNERQQTQGWQDLRVGR
ncbi:WXG100 family type VII secretion target [Streptomyces sp. NPDC094049]|uniref:WXG100 family type VII secretion target n=1 Tax=Streptomyces sp. NPDC094049 TaxID=3154987 RepID=UPI003330268D